MPTPTAPNPPGQAETVLVTGGTGFIGCALVAHLRGQGNSVIVLTRNASRAAKVLGAQVRCIENLAELDLPGNTARVDVVVNLAGARILGWRWTPHRKAVLRESRVGITRSLVVWMERTPHKPRLLLSASAIGYYGTQAVGDDTALGEQAPPQPIFMSELCQEWEAEARRACDLGVSVVCLRLGVVLGPQGSLPLMLLPIRLGLGGPLGSGQQWFSWIHLQDVLAAMAHLWSRPVPQNGARFQAVNLCAPQAVRQREFARTAATVLGRPCFMPTPAWPMQMALGEQAALLVQGQRVAPQLLLGQGFQFGWPDLDTALRHLLGRP